MKDSQETSSACAVNSVLAIGGVGGLAVGLAGREILENLFTGLIILSSSPFEVGGRSAVLATQWPGTAFWVIETLIEYCQT